jgi:hypothetical protein
MAISSDCHFDDITKFEGMKKKKKKKPTFHSFQKVATKIKGCFLSEKIKSYFTYSQIWLYLLMDDCQMTTQKN